MGRITIRLQRPDRSKETVVEDKSELVIGRPGREVKPDLDLSPDLRVSRPHARLSYDLGTWWIEDLASAHGTILNGTRIAEREQVKPGDKLQLGDTLLEVSFEAHQTEPTRGAIERQVPVLEAQSPARVTEHEHVHVIGRIGDVLVTSTGEVMLDGMLRELQTAIPMAQNLSILLREGRELVVKKYAPPPRSTASFTLARKAMVEQQAFRWVRTESAIPLSYLAETTAALYAPMVVNQEVIGVIHVDTTESGNVLTDHDLELLALMAPIIGIGIKAADPAKLDQPPRAFISYAAEQGDEAKRLVGRLAGDLGRNRIMVFRDSSIEIGEDERRAVERVIKMTDAFLPVVAASAPMTQRERDRLLIALKADKPVIPIRIQAARLPETLRRLTPLDVDGERYQPAVAELVERLRALRRAPVVPKESATLERETAMRILFLASNPVDSKRLRLDEEVRTIKQRLRSAEYRNRFDLVDEWAVRYPDLNEALMRHRPHIVHFAGHGTHEGEIALEDREGYGRPVPPKALADLFQVLKDNVRCVVLNACFSQKQARAIAKEIDCVVGMARAVPDDVAIEFASGFYSALGYGRSLKEAFEVGRNQARALDENAAATARIVPRKSVDPADIYFESEGT